MIYDCLVLGTGGIGSAALYHLAAHGANVLGLDRFPPAHDRGSSHGRTRIIRQAYFEHADYVPLVLEAYRLWDLVEAESGQKLRHQVGLMQMGPPEGLVARGVLQSAAQHGLSIEQFGAEALMRRWPGFWLPDAWIGLYEPAAGYLLVEACVQAHLDLAQRRGAQLQTGVTVHRWHADDQGVRLESSAGEFRARHLIVTAGPWAAQLLSDLSWQGQVRRKPQYWFPPGDDRYRVERGCPPFLFDTPEGIFYGFPAIGRWGVKMAQHTGGAVVADPLTVDRTLDVTDLAAVQAFRGRYLPGVEARLEEHSVCMYTLSPDEHFVVDRHPHQPQVSFAAGMSGHGFKFATVLGKILSQLALDPQATAPAFLSAQRPALQSPALHTAHASA